MNPKELAAPLMKSKSNAFTSANQQESKCLQEVWSEGGFTKREEIAKAALQGLLSNSAFYNEAAKESEKIKLSLAEYVSITALNFADALIKKLSA